MATKTARSVQVGRSDTGLFFSRVGAGGGTLFLKIIGVTILSVANGAWTIARSIIPDATNLRTVGSTSFHYLEGWFANVFLGATNAITAHSGGGQGSATALTTGINRVTTAAAAGDSVALPAAVAGAMCQITNATANRIQVFGAGTDTINSIATATGVPQPAGVTRVYYCAVAGNWSTTHKPEIPVGQYAAATNTTAFTATGAQVAGADTVVLDCTGALGSGQALTLPIATDLVAAIPNAFVGQTYRLRIMNRSSGNFAWTVTTASGLTLTGTMTIAQNTYREFLVTLTSLTAVAIQSLGQVIVAA